MLLLLATAVSCKQDQPAVRAIFFYSPTCPHCHEVLTEHLPPLQREYGSQLQVFGADVATPEGQALYQSTVRHYQIENLGVPTMVVGEVVLVGGYEIPQELPGLVVDGLAGGGVDWPDIPGFVPPAR